MNKFLKKSVIFSIPFISIIFITFIIDPYNYFRNTKQNEYKNRIAFIPDRGRRTYLISYKNFPKPNVILGYSQADIIQISNIPESNWCKLTFGGADTWEVIESFEIISKNPKLKKVIIDLNSFNYIRSCSTPYVKTFSRSYKAIELLDHPMLYLIDPVVAESTLSYLKFILINDTTYLKKGKPIETRERFWDSQIKLGEDVFKSNYEVSRKKLKESLYKIKEYCDYKNIEIVVFSSSMNIELQEIAKEFKLKVFLPDIIEIFEEIQDFAYPNAYTKNKENFGDPFHVTSDSVYINTLWKNDTTYCRIVTKDNINDIVN